MFHEKYVESGIEMESFSEIETIDQLREVISTISGDMPVSDGLGDPLKLTIVRAQPTYVEIQ
ncbi:MAG: hypothetical protein C0622_05210 [Desulfuromonas sp.]|nr:MAG: hypothetical protein C0622_05210 [Desulfuromonas sp.]